MSSFVSTRRLNNKRKKWLPVEMMTTRFLSLSSPPPLSPRYTVRVLMFVSVWTLVFENEGGELIKKRMRQFAFHFVIVAHLECDSLALWNLCKRNQVKKRIKKLFVSVRPSYLFISLFSFYGVNNSGRTNEIKVFAAFFFLKKNDATAYSTPTLYVSTLKMFTSILFFLFKSIERFII